MFSSADVKQGLVKTDDELDQHRFSFNPKDNGGERLSLITKFYWNGDLPDKDCWYTNQELRLKSYCNSASFNLSGVQITPAVLRKLADELEQKQKGVQEKVFGSKV